MPTLEIEFTGLCGFVPKYSLDDSTKHNANRVRVLLVDAMGHGGDHGGVHHEPVLVLPLSAVDREGKYRRGWTATTKEGEVVIFSLAHQDLFLGNADTEQESSLLEINADEIGKEACPEPNTQSSLRWLARMKSIYSGAGLVKRAFLTEPFPHGLGARVLLTRGKLANDTFSRLDKQVIQWEFASEPIGSGAAGYHRALSESVKYTLDLGEAMDLTLTTRHMATGATEEVRVRFKDAANRVVGGILNMPWHDILGKHQGGPGGERHFGHFYDLAERTIRMDFRRLPYREAYCDWEPPLVHVGHPKCPPALFEADASV